MLVMKALRHVDKSNGMKNEWKMIVSYVMKGVDEFILLGIKRKEDRPW